MTTASRRSPKRRPRRARASTRHWRSTTSRHAADMLRPVYDAHRQGATAMSAWRSRPISRCAPTRRSPRRGGCGRRSTAPNLMVKMPGTKPGVPAIRTLIEDGININVTLLFSVRRLQGGGRGLYRRARGARRPRAASIAKHRQRRQLLRQPHRRRDRQEDRRADQRQRRRPALQGAARQGRDRQRQDGLPALSRS